MGKHISEKDFIGMRFGKMVVSDSYRKNKRIYCLCVCDCGNTKEVRYDSLKAGTTTSCGCVALDTLRRGRINGLRDKAITDEKCHAVALSNDLVSAWLGPSVSNAKEKTWWECAFCGKEFDATYDNVSHGKGCRYCKGVRSGLLRQNGAEKYHHAAKVSWGISEWIGPEIINIHTKTWWRCSVCELPFERSYSTVMFGDNTGQCCNDCSYKIRGEKHKTQPDEYHIAAKNSDAFSVWLGPEVGGVKEKTWWLCNCGEKVFRSLDAMKLSKGCLKCANKSMKQNIRNSRDDYNNLAAKYGIQWLGHDGDEMILTKDRTTWVCRCGDTFLRSYLRVHMGSFLCPKCSRSMSYSETEAYDVLMSLDVDAEPQKWFDNLRSKIDNTPLYFDFYLPEYGLLLELNGQQHYEYRPHFHRNGPDDLDYQQERDEMKSIWAEKHNLKLKVIPYWDFDRIEEEIIEALK